MFRDDLMINLHIMFKSEKVKTKLQKFIKKIQIRHATPSWKTASAVRKPSISRG